EVERMRGLGLTAAPIAPAIEARELDDWKAKSPAKALALVGRTFLDRAAHEIPDLRAAIAAESPDLLFIDVNAWGAGAAAEASGVPWALFAPYCLPLPSRDAPPFGPGLAPRKGPLGALRDAIVRRLVHGLLNRELPAMNSMRAGAGAPPVAHM